MALRFLLLLFFLPISLAFGHVRNNAFIDLVQAADKLSGSLQLRLEDLPLIAAVDADGNLQLTWGEVKLARAELLQYVTDHLQLGRGNASCALLFGEFQVQQLAGGSYLFIPLDVNCPPAAAALEIQYSLLFARDAAHRGLMKIEHGEAPAVFVFAPGQQKFSMDERSRSGFSYMQTFTEEGIWHIWTGYDHLLFLVALLLPLCGAEQASLQSSWNSLKPVVVKVMKLVTAFTVAHSITLIATSIYQPAFAPALVETLIAVSVVIAGINILLPMFDKSQWRIAFCFGLLHGLGFATALSGLSLPAEYFIECLLSFNLGVELGQLAIILPCIPLLLLLGRQTYYRSLALPVMALAVISCSLWWTIERAAQI